jgi:hypothetical protein
MKKDDIKFALRFAVAVVAAVVIMNVVHHWDQEESQQLRISMMSART